MNQKDLKSTKETRAKRLKVVRQMTGLTRQAFASKYGISFSNFQNWEGPRYGGLTEHGAEKVLAGCHAEGVEATLEWLMHGIEPGPHITEKFYRKNNLALPKNEVVIQSENTELELITNELLLFKRNYQQQVLDMMVNDDGMYPQYKIGDYVAGRIFSGKNLMKLLNLDCIIRLMDDTLVFRNLRHGSSETRFNLVCSNINTSVKKPVLYDVAIVSAAPVTWVRKKSPTI